MTIRDGNYITILAPMITKLKLKGNELLIFSLIHGFSQDGETSFKGSISYLQQWTGLDKSTIISLLKKLVERGYLRKYEYEKNKVRLCEYVSNYFEALEWSENPTTPPLENPTTPRSENPTGAVGKSDSILIDNNTILLDNNKAGENPPLLFPDQKIEEEDKAKKTLFRNSKYADMENFNKEFSGAEFETIDMLYYYHTISDWSDTKNMKRTARGWLATVRQFIRGDVEKKKLHVKHEFKPDNKKVTVAGALEYLKDY